MAKTTARSVMTDSVVSVSPEASLLDVVRVFVQEGIHGAPVVDEDGQTVGVISTSDVLREQEGETDSVWAISEYLREVHEFGNPEGPGYLSGSQDRLAQRTVADVMTKDFVSVPLEATAAQIARCLRENRIHRVWVEDKGRLCGVVSALDLMSVIEEAGD